MESASLDLFEWVFTMMSRQIVVLGMHRSGTSLLTQLLHRMGCWVGADQELMRPDEFNPAGYWEHNAVVTLNRSILQTIGGSWFQRAELRQLSRHQWNGFIHEAREIAASFDTHGTWVAKDPRMVLLFPLWRRALNTPMCVMIWRDPLAVARSLAARDGFPLRFGVLLWELYVRTMLSATIGLPRVLVSYRQLVDDPPKAAHLLQTLLEEFGVRLRFPGEDAVRAVVQRKLDRRSAGNARQDYLLRARHRDLTQALRDCSALSWSSVPEMPSAAAAVLDAFSAHWKGRRVRPTSRVAGRHHNSALSSDL
jgi:hypothetical protein